MTELSTTTPANRARDLFLWALGVLGVGFVLALLIRVIPSEAMHTAGIMFVPLLIPVAVGLAIASIVLACVALVRMRRRPGAPLRQALIPLAGSVLILVILPALVFAVQVLLVAIGDLTG